MAGLVDLTGKAALVTGGSRGVGAATAIMLAQAGAAVAITYKERKSPAEDVLDRIAKVWGGGPSARLPVRPSISIQADVSQPSDCDAMVQQTTEALGTLDIFVANAGIWPPDPLAVKDMGDAHWAETLRVNLNSVFYGCRAALRVMQPGGRIVIPIGGVYEVQRLVVLTKQTDGTRRSRTVMPVRFVPMTGEAQR